MLRFADAVRTGADTAADPDLPTLPALQSFLSDFADSVGFLAALVESSATGGDGRGSAVYIVYNFLQVQSAGGDGETSFCPLSRLSTRLIKSLCLPLHKAIINWVCEGRLEQHCGAVGEVGVLFVLKSNLRVW